MLVFLGIMWYNRDVIKRKERKLTMKLKKIFAIVLALMMLMSAVPISVLAAYEAPTAEEIKNELDQNEGEEIVYASDFEGVIITPQGSAGTQNTKSLISGCTEIKGSYHKDHTIRDYWVNDEYQNIFSDGHSLVLRAHTKTFVTPGDGSDDNNNLQVDFQNNPAGKDFVIAFDITQYQDYYNKAFPYYLYTKYTTKGSISSHFLKLDKDGKLKAGNKVVAELEVGESASIAVHVRIVEPDATNARGKVLYDVYIDGVIKAEGLDLLSEADITTLSKTTGSTAGDADNTGLATDYRPGYVRFMHVNGNVQAADASGNSLGANGADLVSLDAVKIYYSDVCYETMSTVEKASLGYNDEGYDLTLRMALDNAFANDKGAMARLTTASGKVVESDIPEADKNGSYSLTFAVPEADYAGEFTLELISSDGSVYSIYENGKPKNSYKSSIKVLEAEIYDFSATIMPVYGARKAVVSLTFDDAHYPSALVVEELCEKYGMKASMMLICSRIKNDNSGHVDAATWQALFEKGYLEPQSHSMTHIDLRSTTDKGALNQSEEIFDEEIVESQAYLKELFPEYDFITYAIPYGSMSDEAAEIAVKTYYASRGVYGKAVQSLDPSFGIGNGTWGKLYSPGVVKKDADGNVVSEEEQLEYLYKWVDDTVAAGGWFVPYIHKVGDVEDTEMTYNVINKFFAYIDTYQDAGDVWVATFSDAVKYTRERQNTEASVRYEAGKLYLTLTMSEVTEDGLPLSTDVFDHPLTVKVEVPEAYDSVHYLLNGKLMSADTFTDGDSTYAYVDAVPNGEEITLLGSHSYSEFEKADESVHKKTCACGKTVSEAHTDNGYGYCTVCELDLAGISLEIASDLAIKFHVDVRDTALKSEKDISMRFTANGKAVTVTEYIEDDGQYVFTFDGIGPHQAGLTVDAEILIGGEVAEKKTGYSIEGYCRDALELYPDDTELVALINDLLIYARAAEQYVLGEITIAESMELTSSEYTPSEDDDALTISGNESDDLFISSVGVRFDTVNRVFFKIFSESDDFTVELYDSKTTKITTLTKEELVYENGYYVAYSLPVFATDFGAAGLQSITLKDASGKVASEVSYTVNTYAYYMSEGSENVDMAALALALYRYGASAEAYAARLGA